MKISVGDLRTRKQNANGSEHGDGLRVKTGLAEMLKGGVIQLPTGGVGTGSANLGADAYFQTYSRADGLL